ncbi:MAG: ATP-binding protein [Streptococcaceae bacterium]|jgi:hypothetical protein|nr:ATP-binding protein [Streptococcaceae bacterium]
MIENPFNPSFGERPERFIGREQIISNFVKSLKNPNSPWKTSIITGIRGSGKTAILADITKEFAQDKSVITVSMDASDNLLEDALSRLYYKLPKTIVEELSGTIEFSFLGMKAGIQQNGQNMPSFLDNFSYQLMQMLKILQKKEIKVLFLIDEIQRHTGQMRTFASTYQILKREGFQVYMMMAGLPQALSDVLNDDLLTFLNRAKRVQLENIPVNIVTIDYMQAFQKRNLNLSEHFFEQAAQATLGYPYLMQLIGYYLWENADDEMNDLALKKAIIQAKEEVFQNVADIMFRALSENDQAFLFHMVQDTNFSTIKDIQKRFGESKGYVGVYRKRLIDVGVIEVLGHGKLG